MRSSEAQLYSFFLRMHLPALPHMNMDKCNIFWRRSMGPFFTESICHTFLSFPSAWRMKKREKLKPKRKKNRCREASWSARAGMASAYDTATWRRWEVAMKKRYRWMLPYWCHMARLSRNVKIYEAATGQWWEIATKKGCHLIAWALWC